MPQSEESLGTPMTEADINQEVPYVVINSVTGTAEGCGIFKSQPYKKNDVATVQIFDIDRWAYFEESLYNIGLAADESGNLIEHVRTYPHPQPCKVCGQTFPR